MGSNPDVLQPVEDENQSESVELFQQYSETVIQHLERSLEFECSAQCSCGWRVSKKDVLDGGKGVREHIVSHIKGEPFLCPICHAPRRKLGYHYMKQHKGVPFPSEFPRIRPDMAAVGLCRILECFPQFFQMSENPQSDSVSEEDDPDWEFGVCEYDFEEMMEMSEKYTFYQREVAEAVKAEVEDSHQSISCYACDHPFEPENELVGKIEKHVLEHLEATPFRCKLCQALVPHLETHLIEEHFVDAKETGPHHIRAKLASKAFENLFECFPGFFDVLDTACPIEERPKSPAVTFTIIEDPIFVHKTPPSNLKRKGNRKPGTPYPEIIEVLPITEPSPKKTKISSSVESPSISPTQDESRPPILTKSSSINPQNEEMSEEDFMEQYKSEVDAMKQKMSPIRPNDQFSTAEDPQNNENNYQPPTKQTEMAEIASENSEKSQIEHPTGNVCPPESTEAVPNPLTDDPDSYSFPEKKAAPPKKPAQKGKQKKTKSLNNTISGVPKSPKKPKKPAAAKRASTGAIRKTKKAAQLDSTLPALKIQSSPSGKTENQHPPSLLQQLSELPQITNDPEKPSAASLDGIQSATGAVSDKSDVPITEEIRNDEKNIAAEEIPTSSSAEKKKSLIKIASEASSSEENRQQEGANQEQSGEPAIGLTPDESSESESKTGAPDLVNEEKDYNTFSAQLERLVSENKKLICQIDDCNKKIQNADSAKIIRHLSIDHKLKTNYICEQCNKKFIQRLRVVTHIKKSHSDKQGLRPKLVNNEEMLSALQKFQALI